MKRHICQQLQREQIVLFFNKFSIKLIEQESLDRDFQIARNLAASEWKHIDADGQLQPVQYIW